MPAINGFTLFAVFSALSAVDVSVPEKNKYLQINSFCSLYGRLCFAYHTFILHHRQMIQKNMSRMMETSFCVLGFHFMAFIFRFPSYSFFLVRQKRHRFVPKPFSADMSERKLFLHRCCCFQF